MWFEGRLTTYEMLDRRADQVANGLLQLGLTAGSRVVYLGKNSDLFFEILFGAARAGIVVTPLNWRLAKPELQAIIHDSGARTIFAGSDFAAVTRELIGRLESDVKLFVLEQSHDASDFSTWRELQSAAPCASAAKVSDAVLQLYTSGTTGLPKGVVLTHRSLLAHRNERFAPLPDWNTWHADDVSLVAMPVFHIAGSGSGLTAICSGSGALSVVMREFNVDELMGHLESDWLTKMFLVPACLHLLLLHPRSAQLRCSRLRFVCYGASPMRVDLLRESMARFPFTGFAQFYGLTETSGFVIVLSPQDHASGSESLLRSAGRAIGGVEMKVIGQHGDSLPADAVGEILVRSESTMAGYWNRPEVTAAAIDAEGWFHTGDAGYVDANGYLFIQDRVRDMIVSGGENIYPAEVENALVDCPGVLDVAVIGVPDETWGEAVKAIVVPTAGMQPAREDIVAWARSRIAGYKLPKSVDFIEALPRNASGKVLRRVLRERYWAGVARRVN